MENQAPQPGGQEAYPHQPGAEERKKADTRKKWFWGCGGCLVALILITVVLGFLSTLLWKQLEQGSNQASEAIFGNNTPAGYVVLGAQLPPGTGVRNLVLLMNHNNRQQMIFGFDSTLSEEQAALIRQGQASEGAIGQLLQDSLASAPGQSGGVQVDRVRIDQMKMAVLPKGGNYPVISAKIEDSGSFSPVVIALLPHANNRLVGLAGVDVVTKSAQPDADFSSSYNILQGTVQGIIVETDLDETAQLQ